MWALSLIPLVSFFVYWVLKPWQNSYYLDTELVDWKTYGDFNVFKTPLRKIYRPHCYAKTEYDIFVLRKCNRFKKEIEYVLTDLDDTPEIIQQLKENSNG